MLSGVVSGADELPKSDPYESFEVEPPLLIPYREQEPAAGDATVTTAAPVVDVERLSKEVERAKRSAISAERLFRIGALAKVEAEQRALKAVRLQADLEKARLAEAKASLSAHVETNPQGVAPASISDAELARTIAAAHAAAKKLEQAELAAAQINLTRQQKLLSLGIGRKSDVVKAERKLQELKAAQSQAGGGS